MPNLQAVLRQEIVRIARREARSELESTKKAVARYRREIAELKRVRTELERRVDFLEQREAGRLAEGPARKAPPKGTRFSNTALRARREKLDLSREEYARLVGVSASTLYNWESGSTRPGKEHLATLVTLRSLGKREAKKRLELLGVD
jgi:DNA-binding transcriptional regulator YiaG